MDNHIICHVTTTQIEMTCLIYECDLDYKYGTSISNSGDMFESTIKFYTF